MGTVNIDNSNFDGSSARIIASITTTGEGYGQWKVAVAVDPQEWVLTAAQARSQSAMTEIFNAEVQRMLNDPTIKNIPADKEQVVREAQIVLAKDRPSPMTPPS